MTKNKFIIPIILILLLTFGYFLFFSKTQTKEYKITIISIVEIEPIKQLREGFKTQIQNSEFGKKNNIIWNEENAQGDNALISQIVDKVIADKPDLVYVLGTPISQALQNRDKNITIVQGAVTDPIAAGLANTWESSGKNYTGNSDLPPINIQVDLIKKLIPNLSKLGVIYNPGEINSVAVVARLKQFITNNKLSIEVIESPSTNSSELEKATASLINRVTALYIPPDNTVHSGLKTVCKIANENGIPVFATTETALDDGALAGLSLDFYILGKEAGDLALLIIEGKKKASEIPIKTTEKPIIFINSNIAKQLSIDISSFKNDSNIIIR